MNLVLAWNALCSILLTFPLTHVCYGIAVDADEIAAQIEKERKKQLDLLRKLFPEDKDAGLGFSPWGLCSLLIELCDVTTPCEACSGLTENEFCL